MSKIQPCVVCGVDIGLIIPEDHFCEPKVGDQSQSKETYIIFNRVTKAFIRVVEVDDKKLVTMSGPWSFNYSFISWSDALAAIEETYL